MKYLVHRWGLPKFIDEIEKRMGKKLEPYRELPEWKFEDYLGWHEQGDGQAVCRGTYSQRSGS